MRESWYGDNRDLVKWGLLVALAREAGARLIVQVAYLTASQFPFISLGNREVAVDRAVWRHFRRLQSVVALGNAVGLNVSIFERPFLHADRRDYHQELVSALDAVTERKVVLLDPDTGLSPKHPSAAHVRDDEVSQVWHSLVKRDVLVLYQHQYRSTQWIDESGRRFRAACGGCRYELATARKVAHDVAFHVAHKLD
ncbi:MAG: hypothetical protein PVH40_04090 [Gemmatimonadales bacterium]